MQSLHIKISCTVSVLVGDIQGALQHKCKLGIVFLEAIK